ncbi:MAG: FdtA/QdtA family cupin domain-containing protein [Anaerolineaceae bacterium]|nr:FdtA/QdtA family cupin domain-containing protein [Anaerolineaceae bacterium]
MVETTDVKLLQFTEFGDERGRLVVVEGSADIPFDIKRVFYIYGSDREVVRGRHANRRSEFVLINVVGTSRIRVIDRFGNDMIISLSQPHTGVYLPAMVWKEMYDFSDDSVLLVLSSEHYDPDEYIRDFEEFRRICENGQA